MNKSFHPLIVFGATLLIATPAFGHTAWLEPVADKPGDFKVMFGGHAGKLESYPAAKIKTVEAFDANGGFLRTSRTSSPDGVVVHIDGKPGTILMHFDNGIHTRSPSGPSIEKPMDEVAGATHATCALKYHKSILVWSEQAKQPAKQPLEVIPLDNEAPRAGEPMRVRVISDGKPAAGIRLGHGEEGKPTDPVTDAEGIASFVPVAGFNKLWAGKRIAVNGNSKYTELSYEYLLAFTAR